MSETNINSLPAVNETLSVVIANACLQDREFAQDVKDNPAQVLEDIAKTPLPEGVDIKVALNTQDTVYVPIPSFESVKGDRLTDEQMKQISGGEVVITAIATSAATIGVASTALIIGTVVGVGVTAVAAVVTAGVLGARAARRNRS